MAIRRMDQRRRRVVLEEVTQSGRDDSGVPESVKQTRSGQKSAEPSPKVYSNSAQRRHQKKTTDLFPKRFRSVALVVVLLVGCVCGLNALSIYSAGWQEVFSSSQMRAFSLSGNGSLSSWFSAFLLVLAGLASLQIYAMRQHRCDDYRGTYRLWSWLAGLFMLGSIQCVVDLVGLSHSVANHFLGAAVGSGFVWLVAVELLLLSFLVIRGLFEVRNSISTFVSVLVAWLLYSSAIVLEIPAIQGNFVQGDLVLGHELYYGNCLLVGTCALFMAVVQYARFVFLHSNGLLEIRMNKESRQNTQEVQPIPVQQKPVVSPSPLTSRDAEAKELLIKKSIAKQKLASAQKSKPKPTSSSPMAKSAKKTKTTSPLGSRIKNQPVSHNDFSFDLDDDDEIVGLTQKANLSKSERRRLRKLQKRKNRAA